MIPFANACSEPYTMMIKLENTFITILTMLGAWWLSKVVISKRRTLDNKHNRNVS